MPKYLVSTIEQIEREYVVEAKDEEAAFQSMTNPEFIRVCSPPYEKTRRKATRSAYPLMAESMMENPAMDDA